MKLPKKVYHRMLDGRTMVFELGKEPRYTHPFVWGFADFLPGTILGATQKEAEEMLVEGIEYALDHPPFRSHAYTPCPMYPSYSPKKPSSWWWQPRW